MATPLSTIGWAFSAGRLLDPLIRAIPQFMKKITASLTQLAALGLGLGLTSAPALEPARDPASLWSLDVESGSLWRVSGNTFVDYVVLPQIISLRTPAHFRLGLGEGELTIRSRLSLLLEAIPVGPETGYFGFSASPSIEYWFPGHATAIYASIGGGFGYIDSTDVPGGQGQDFTLNWFASAGVRHYLGPDFSLNAGVMFQHWSNGGATDPNPGLDALGPVLGVSWTF